VGFAMREVDLFVWTYIHVATDLLLPVFMIALAWAGIWIATDRQVIRWIDYMRRIAAAYAGGHYTIRPAALADAPSEFRLLGDTLSGMAAAIQDRDKRLRDAVAQKTLLIKETHHRIKNNLQIVMSLLNLQAGQLRDPAAQDALKQAQVRVNALALVHNILHEIEDQSSVDLKRLLSDLVEQLYGGLGGEGHGLRVETDIVSRQASSDLAVPLTLFTVEALTNVFKHAYSPTHRGGLVRVSLQPTGNGKLKLIITDDGIGLDATMQKGIGSRLINAFAQQIGGVATLHPLQGGGTAAELVFPDPEASKITKEEEKQSGLARGAIRASLP
jgi:two-component sensor histidine kinase